jgi:hypothetical protein
MFIYIARFDYAFFLDVYVKLTRLFLVKVGISTAFYYLSDTRQDFFVILPVHYTTKST